MRRIGVPMKDADDPVSALVAAFTQGLAGLGWTIDRNVQIEYCFAAGDPERYRQYAGELVALTPIRCTARSHIARSKIRFVAALHHLFLLRVRSGSVAAAKPCLRWRQLSPKAAMVSSPA